MNIQRSKLKYFAIFVAGIFATSVPAMAHADWSITGLGTLGGTGSYAAGINDLGQVAGKLLLRMEIAMLSSRALTVPE